MRKNRLLLVGSIVFVVCAIGGVTLASVDGLLPNLTRFLGTKDARSDESTIYGTVTDADTGKPIPNAYVRYNGSVNTDENGVFAIRTVIVAAVADAVRHENPTLDADDLKWPVAEFRKLHDGTYKAEVPISVMAKGYQPGETTIQLGVGETARVEIKLQPRAKRDVTEAGVWADAKSKSKVPLLKPGWMPTGFAVADVYDEGSADSPFGRDNPSVGSDGLPQIQYGNGAQYIIVHEGNLGDFGEDAPKDLGEVRGVQAQGYGGPGAAFVVWTEHTKAGDVRYTIEGDGDESVITFETLLKIARSMQEY